MASSRTIIIIILVLLGLIGAVAAILSNIAADELLKRWKRYRRLALPLFGLVTLMSIVLGIWLYNVERSSPESGEAVIFEEAIVSEIGPKNHQIPFNPLLPQLYLNLSIASLDWIRETEIGLAVDTQFTPRAVVLERPDYDSLQDVIKSEPSNDRLQQLIKKLWFLDPPIYETSSPEIKMFLSNDSPSGSPTVILEGLALEVIDVQSLGNPFVLRYTIPGATGTWRGGYVRFADEPGLYPVNWAEDGEEDKHKAIPPKYLTLTPGEVEGLYIAIAPEESAKPGIYLMRFVGIIRTTGQAHLLYSHEIFRCAVLATNHWEAEGELADHEIVEHLRRRAYLDSETFFRVLSGKDPSDLAYKKELALALLPRIPRDRRLLPETIDYLQEYLQATSDLQDRARLENIITQLQSMAGP